MTVGFLDLPHKLHAVVAAELEPAAFCALRRTCRELARLPFADYAIARCARMAHRPYSVVKVLRPLFKHAVGAFASVEAPTQHALLAALVGDCGFYAYLLAVAAEQCGQTYVLDWLDVQELWRDSRVTAHGGRITAEEFLSGICRAVMSGRLLL